jgi:hypothetical protein
MTLRVESITTISEKLPAEVKNLRADDARTVKFEVNSEMFDLQWSAEYTPSEAEVQACVDDLVVRTTGKVVDRTKDGAR